MCAAKMGSDPQNSSIGLARTALAAMLAEAARRAPNEACGLLLGEPGTILRISPCANLHPDPSRFFEIDPAALIAAHRAARAGGPALLGYFHSHPIGPAAPSAEDARQATGDGRIWAISGGGMVNLFRDAAGGFEALFTRLVDG